MERRVSQDSQGLRVVPVALASLALAMPEHPAFAESPGILVYLGCQDNQVYLDREVSDARTNRNNGHK